MLKKLIQQLIKKGLWKGVKQLLRSRISRGKHPDSLISDPGERILQQPDGRNLVQELIDNYKATGVWDYSIFKSDQRALEFEPKSPEEVDVFGRLAEINGLEELLPNTWFDAFGNEYYLTKMGFRPKGGKI